MSTISWLCIEPRLLSGNDSQLRYVSETQPLPKEVEPALFMSPTSFNVAPSLNPLS